MAAAAVPPPPQCYTNTPGETSMTVWWQAPPAGGAGVPPAGAVSGLVLEVREFPHPWDAARRIDGIPLDATTHDVRGLVPTATFEFRLRYALPDGTLSAPGPHATADTLAAGCVPKGDDGGKSKKGCTVQ